MNYAPVSYRTKLKNLSLKHPWVNPKRVKPMPGHIDLIVRLLAMCESAMGTLSPEFSVFQVRYLQNRMKITAIPALGSACESTALRQAISLTLNEARIVCPHCGDYQVTPQSLEDVYVCCASSGDIALWEAIPDIMALLPKATICCARNLGEAEGFALRDIGKLMEKPDTYKNETK